MRKPWILSGKVKVFRERQQLVEAKTFCLEVFRPTRNHELMDNAPKLVTPGVIAERIGVPFHRVRHILATRIHIQPAARAGLLRLYHDEAVAQVRYELNLIDARRAERKGEHRAP